MARKNDEYFSAFITLVDYACSAANYLHESLSNLDPSSLRERMERLHSIEHGADEEKHRMMRRLVKEFVTPIEREDIIDLANEIDEVTDTIEDVLIRIYMYNITEIRPDALAFSSLIKQCCEALNVAVKELPNFHKSETLHQAIVDVNTLEEDGDAIYIESMRTLYTDGSDPISVVAWSETYDRLEECCDACEHVANLVESVAMKNS
jgi:uncharacterized protein Yka (UPF0111/DUF47 family)